MQGKHDVDLDWLLDFTALAATGSFTKAAETRHVTQPAFSRRVRALEDWVGAPLFARTAQGSVLTPAGQRFGSDVPALLRTLETLRRETREVARAEAPTLRFAATHALSFTFFPQWLRGVAHHPPTGSIQLLSDTMQACETMMQEGRAHFLLCHHHDLLRGPMLEPPFEGADIGQDRLVPYARAMESGAPAWHIAQSDNVPLLGYSEESGLARILAAHGLERRCPAIHRVFSAQLAFTLLGMVRQGDGVAWLPQSLASDSVAGGEIVAAGDSSWTVPVTVRVFRSSVRQSPTIEAFWDAVHASASRPS